MLYDIECQIFFPTTMYTPGFEEESKTKPALTAEIEGADEGQTPEQAAKGMYEGFVKGHAHISADFTTSLFRAGTRGATPRSNAFVDFWLDLLHFVSTGSFLGEARLTSCEDCLFILEAKCG